MCLLLYYIMSYATHARLISMSYPTLWLVFSDKLNSSLYLSNVVYNMFYLFVFGLLESLLWRRNVPEIFSCSIAPIVLLVNTTIHPTRKTTTTITKQQQQTQPHTCLSNIKYISLLLYIWMYDYLANSMPPGHNWSLMGPPKSNLCQVTTVHI